MATRQHALLGIMHDATHYRITRSRALNDFVVDLFCAFPIGLSTELYRREHLPHHEHLNTNQDPYWAAMQSHEDWIWPKDHVQGLKMFAFDLCGLAAHKTLLLLFHWSPLQVAVSSHVPLRPADRVRGAVWLVSVTALCWAYQLWWIVGVFWLIPLVTVFGALIRLRSIAEHLVVPSEHELNRTRHVNATWFEKLCLAPVNLNYHLAHHLFPSVPFYRLPQLHAVLMNEPEFVRHAHFTDSYLGLKKGVLGEVLRNRKSNETANA